MLAELEEIISYKDHADEPDRQETQRKTWSKRYVALATMLILRLDGCQRDVEVWQRILQVRSLVLTPTESMDTWIAFADLCRDSDRLNLAEKTLTSLVGSSYNAHDPEVSTLLMSNLPQSRARAPPPVIFAYFRLAWAKGATVPPVMTDIGPINQDRWQTLQYLREFTSQLTIDIGAEARDQSGNLILPEEKLYGEYTRLLARCHVELGSWQSTLLEDPYQVRFPLQLALSRTLTFSTNHRQFCMITNLQQSSTLGGTKPGTPGRWQTLRLSLDWRCLLEGYGQNISKHSSFRLSRDFYDRFRSLLAILCKILCDC